MDKKNYQTPVMEAYKLGTNQHMMVLVGSTTGSQPGFSDEPIEIDD